MTSTERPDDDRIARYRKQADDARGEGLYDTGLLQAVALDPYGVGSIVDALYEVGISGQDTIVGISQGWKLSGAIKTPERKLADRTLVHGGRASWPGP